MKTKKAVLTMLVSALLLVVSTVAVATYVVPEINNQIILSGREDVDLRNVRYIEVNPRMLHEVLIPFSKGGLGGADEYLGEIAIGVPVQGGAYSPGGRYIDPINKVIAIHDTGADLTRLYDFAGNPLGARDGVPHGFIRDGSLVAWRGRELRLYDKNGRIIWQREPYEEVKRRFWIDRSLEWLGGFSGGTIRISPDGDIYVPFFIQLGRTVPRPMETPPFPHLPESNPWMSEVVNEVDGTLVYNRHGELIDIKSGSWSLVFTPSGNAFSTSVPYGDGVAHREFDLRRTNRASDGLTTPTFRRSIVLRPTWMLTAISVDFAILCSRSTMHDGDTMRPYAVYRLNQNNAISFSLPMTQVISGTDGDRQFYTSELERKGVRIRTYEWPKP